MLADLLFPRRCPSCDARATWLCDGCLARVRWIDACCDRCGRPSAEPRAGCRACRSPAPCFDRARAAAVYDGPIRDALLAFKLRGERRAATVIAEAMMAAARSLGGDVVTAVPSTRRVRSQRGFDPAEELARAVAVRLRRPFRPLLRKVRETADQAGLDRTRRRANQAGAFVARPPSAGLQVLLVDDVMTTGATADACARALRDAGAAEIAVLTFARAI